MKTLRPYAALKQPYGTTFYRPQLLEGNKVVWEGEDCYYADDAIKEAQAELDKRNASTVAKARRVLSRA